MEFCIGQIFEGVYPPEAAFWCNNNNAHIEEIEGVYTIVENAKPVITTADLVEFLYQEKCKVAYGGITIVKGGESYLFETTQDSITMCNSMALAMTTQADDFNVSWKVWQGDIPVMLSITKAEFNTIFAFGMTMINTAFAVEGALNAEAQRLTEEQLTDDELVQAFKDNAVEELAAVQTTMTLE